jgi:hypothetical protein
VTPREWQAARTRIWRAGTGCECPATIDGKLVAAKDRCSTTWVRCNARLEIIHQEYKKMGPCPECGRSMVHEPECKLRRARIKGGINP